MTPDTFSIPGYTIFREGANGSSPVQASLEQTSVHPLDQLSIEEITYAAKLIRAYATPRNLKFNCITLREPLKSEYAAYRTGQGPRPDRRAFAVVIEGGTHAVIEVVANLAKALVEVWKPVSNVAPTLTLEDLGICERVCREDPRVVEVCREIGITDMSRILLDAWAIGFDNRWGFDRRLQQVLAYYRTSELDNHYAYLLDFTVVIDTEREQVLAVDVRRVNGERVPVPMVDHNYLPQFIGNSYVHDRLKPIDIT